jgi:ATP-dependent Clp protease adaptor protein ClpS
MGRGGEKSKEHTRFRANPEGSAGFAGGGSVVFLAFFGYADTMPHDRGDGVALLDRREEQLKEPEEYRVILLNDDYTTMEFVVEILMLIFHKNIEDAGRIMMDVHKRGRGIVGVYPWDIARTKADQVHRIARENEYPLKCMVEPV